MCGCYICGSLPAGSPAAALGDPHVFEDGEGLCQLGLQLDEAVRLLGGGPLDLGGRRALAPLQEGEGLREILVQLRGLCWIYCLNEDDSVILLRKIMLILQKKNSLVLLGYCVTISKSIWEPMNKYFFNKNQRFCCVAV